MSFQLSQLDKQLIKILLEPDGKRTSGTLAKKLGIPLTTIQRRRKRLEQELLTLHYTLKLENFNWRRVDIFISTKNGETDSVANELLKLDEVTFAGKSIGEHTIDLKVEAIVKYNSQLLDLLEKVEALENVNDVIWSEVVEVVGKKRSVSSNIIDQLV
jgi:DNA-binding Lrp family transcriptional regulator